MLPNKHQTQAWNLPAREGQDRLRSAIDGRYTRFDDGIKPLTVATLPTMNRVGSLCMMVVLSSAGPTLAHDGATGVVKMLMDMRAFFAATRSCSGCYDDFRQAER